VDIINVWRSLQTRIAEPCQRAHFGLSIVNSEAWDSSRGLATFVLEKMSPALAAELLVSLLPAMRQQQAAPSFDIDIEMFTRADVLRVNSAG
jgi:hypothetical protein